MLETLRLCLGLTNRIALTSNGRGGRIHTLQWSDRAFYRWLLDIGLTPAKSLTLRPLVIPDEYFPDFFRGCIDGNGSVRVYTDRYHVPKNPKYVYTRLYVSLVSASPSFLTWVQSTARRVLGVAGVECAELTVLEQHAALVGRIHGVVDCGREDGERDAVDVECLRSWCEPAPR